MRGFTAGELSRMRGVQEGAMQDTCRVLVHSSTDDRYNYPVPSYSAGSEQDAQAVACGLRLFNPEEIQASGRVPAIDGEIRLPLDTSIDPRDRIEVTHRYGELLDEALVFEISGPARRGPTGLVLDLRLVTDGTG